MADRKSEEKDKGRDIPSKRFVKIFKQLHSILFIQPTLFHSDVQKIVRDLNFVTSMECRYHQSEIFLVFLSLRKIN